MEEQLQESLGAQKVQSINNIEDLNSSHAAFETSSEVESRWNVSDPDDCIAPKSISVLPASLTFIPTSNPEIEFELKLEFDEIWDYSTIVNPRRNGSQVHPWFPVLINAAGFKLHQCNVWVFNSLDEYLNGLKSYLEYQATLYKD